MKNKRYENFDAQIRLLADLQNESMRTRKAADNPIYTKAALDRELALQDIINTLRFVKGMHVTLNEFYQLWS